VDYTAPHVRTIERYYDRDTSDGRTYRHSWTITRTTKAPLERFMALVEKRDDGCWMWRGHIDKKSGRGSWRMPEDSHATPAHRAAYRMFVGPIPKGLQLDHLCCVPSCVNPAHLEPVTPLENVRRTGAGQAITCRRGHVLAGDNLGKRSDGRRYCKTCSRMRQSKYWAKGKR
jgi:hypothetical protein